MDSKIWDEIGLPKRTLRRGLNTFVSRAARACTLKQLKDTIPRHCILDTAVPSQERQLPADVWQTCAIQYHHIHCHKLPFNPQLQRTILKVRDIRSKMSRAEEIPLVGVLYELLMSKLVWRVHPLHSCSEVCRLVAGDWAST